jgi:hypothetical protein
MKKIACVDKSYGIETYQSYKKNISKLLKPALQFTFDVHNVNVCADTNIGENL